MLHCIVITTFNIAFHGVHVKIMDVLVMHVNLIVNYHMSILFLFLKLSIIKLVKQSFF